MIKKMNLLSHVLLLSVTSLALSCSKSNDSAPAAAPIAPTKPVIETIELAPIQKQNTLFKKFGSVQKFEWVPTGYQAGFVYDIHYYIPTSIQKTTNSPALVFMHGGGESTLTRDGSNKAVNIYVKEVIAAAEKYKFIAVLPSSNGLNWGGHTQRLMTEMATLLRAHLNFDTNRLGLSGHSKASWSKGTFSAGFPSKTETYKRSLSNFNTSVKNSQAQSKASFLK